MTISPWSELGISVISLIDASILVPRPQATPAGPPVHRDYTNTRGVWVPMENTLRPKRTGGTQTDPATRQRLRSDGVDLQNLLRCAGNAVYDAVPAQRATQPFVLPHEGACEGQGLWGRAAKTLSADADEHECTDQLRLQEYCQLQTSPSRHRNLQGEQLKTSQMPRPPHLLALGRLLSNPQRDPMTLNARLVAVTRHGRPLASESGFAAAFPGWSKSPHLQAS